MTLPISVILPTRDAMGAIEAHVAAISQWLPRVQQVIVVDSSEDGTLEFLRGELASLPNVEFYPRPRGLYESWNFAIQRAAAEFVYVSTVGDTILEGADGIEHLLEMMRAHRADVVISPPMLVDEHGEPCANRRWPVHEVGARLQHLGPRLLTPSEALLHTMSYVPETILGSSASNLYRREFLVAHPFPEAWGHCADSLWMAAHALRMRVVVTPREVARFVMHPTQPGSLSRHLGAEQFADFFTKASESLAESGLAAGEREVLRAWLDSIQSRYGRAMLSQQIANQRVIEQRQKIATITALLVTARGHTEDFRGGLIESKKTVAALRREIADLQRQQRSLRLMVGQWVARKLARFRRDKRGA